MHAETFRAPHQFGHLPDLPSQENAKCRIDFRRCQKISTLLTRGRATGIVTPVFVVESKTLKCRERNRARLADFPTQTLKKPVPPDAPGVGRLGLRPGWCQDPVAADVTCWDASSARSPALGVPAAIIS